MLARAVVELGTRPVGSTRRLRVERERRRRAERLEAEAGSAENRPHRVEVHALSVVRSAHHGDLGVGQLFVDESYRDRGLERLHRRPRIGDAVGFPGGGDQLPVRVHHCHRAHVHGLDEPGAHDLDQRNGWHAA
jgi:hypothetical protein